MIDKHQHDSYASLGEYHKYKKYTTIKIIKLLMKVVNDLRINQFVGYF